PAGDPARLEPLAAPAVAPAASAVAMAAPAAPEARPVEPVRALLAQLMRLWGVTDDLGPAVLAAWPAGSAGALDVPAVAARYQLAGTFFADSGLPDLRAVGLPALISVEEQGARQPYLLRRLDRESATLVAATGEERRLSVDRLDPAWL